MKKIIIITTILFSPVSFANVKSCGEVEILKVLAGPRHGAMMQVSDSTCGAGGYVCLDPGAEIMSQTESDRLYSLVLGAKLSGKKIQLNIYTDVFATACSGNYPVVEDARLFE